MTMSYCVGTSTSEQYWYFGYIIQIKAIIIIIIIITIFTSNIGMLGTIMIILFMTDCQTQSKAIILN